MFFSQTLYQHAPTIVMRLSDNTYISIKSLILMYSYISQYNFGEYTIYTKQVFLIILN